MVTFEVETDRLTIGEVKAENYPSSPLPQELERRHLDRDAGRLDAEEYGT